MAGTVLNSRTTKNVARKTASLESDDGEALDKLEEFARQLATSLESSMPRCKLGDWKGTVTVVLSQNRTTTTTSGQKVTDKGEARLSCMLSGQGISARCSYSSSNQTSGGRQTITTTKIAANVETGVSIEIEEDKLKIGFGDIPVEVTTKDTVGTPNLGTSSDTIQMQDYLLPLGADPKRQAGSWTNPNAAMKELGIQETVSWSLTRE